MYTHDIMCFQSLNKNSIVLKENNKLLPAISKQFSCRHVY